MKLFKLTKLERVCSVICHLERIFIEQPEERISPAKIYDEIEAGKSRKGDQEEVRIH